MISKGLKGVVQKDRRGNEEDLDRKIREAFSILSQGVEMVHYNVINGKFGKTRVKKIVWMDPDILRICVDIARPSTIDRAKGKVPPGAYLRDVAEVREGAEAYDFRRSTQAPQDDDNCLSLIGTECVLCLELPSKFSRDWFLERFQLIIDDVLTDEEKVTRDKRSLKSTIFGLLHADEAAAAEQMKGLLLRGIQILHHHPNGRIIRSFIVFDEENSRLVVQPVERSFFIFFSPKILSLHTSDIAEIRPGTHSMGFVRTNSTDKNLECMSIIGTECTLDLQLATNSARELFSQKLRFFIQMLESTEDVDQEFY